MRILKKRWVFALVGSLLVLTSTFATGFVVDKEEQRAKKAERDASDAERDLEHSYKAGERSLTQLETTLTQMSMYTRPGFAQFDMSFLNSGLYAGLTHAQEAAGPDLDKEVISKVQTVKQRIDNNGQVDVMSDFKEAHQKLTEEALNYQTQLRTKKAGLDQERNSAEQTSGRVRSVAIVLQVVGLVLLLFKEAPDYPS